VDGGLSRDAPSDSQQPGVGTGEWTTGMSALRTAVLGLLAIVLFSVLAFIGGIIQVCARRNENDNKANDD
jgi:hypothetical protein